MSIQRPRRPAFGCGLMDRQRVLLAWLIYLLVAPTIGFGWIDSWHNEQRAVQVVLLACTAVAYCVIGLLTRPEESVGRWHLPALLLVFLALGLISATARPVRVRSLGRGQHVRPSSDTGDAYRARRFNRRGHDTFVGRAGSHCCLRPLMSSASRRVTWRQLISIARSTSMC